MNQREGGFTLIELIVVIVILGILAAVAIPQFTDTAASARQAARQGACSAIASSAVLLYASTKAANTATAIAANVTTSTDLTITSSACNNFSVQVAPETAGVQCAGLSIPSGLCSGP